LPWLTGFVSVKPTVAELGLQELPAGAVEFLDARVPRFGGENRYGAIRLVQLDAVRQSPRRRPLAQYDFSDGKGSEDTEFVRGGVERIPQGLERPATFLGE